MPIQLPIGAEENFEGVVDLVKMKAISGTSDQGTSFELVRSRPNAGRGRRWRENMVEAAAEADEELMEKYLEDGELTEDEITQACAAHAGERDRADAVRLGVQEQGRAGHARRGHRLHAVAARRARDHGHARRRAKVDRAGRDDEPFAALAFKIATDPFVGKLTFFRVYSGVLKSGDTVYNPVKGKKERVGRILQMHANNREEIKEVAPATSPPRWASRTSPPATRCAT